MVCLAPLPPQYSSAQLACVMRKKEDEVVICLILDLHLDRGTEASEQGGHWLTGYPCEDKLLLLLTYPQHSCGASRLSVLPLQPTALFKPNLCLFRPLDIQSPQSGSPFFPLPDVIVTSDVVVNAQHHSTGTCPVTAAPPIRNHQGNT